MELLDQYGHNGIVTRVSSTEAEGGKLVIQKWQDVTASQNFAKAMGGDADVWRAGVKKSWAMAGHIPAIEIVELRKIGVDVMKAPLAEIRAGLRKLGKEHYIWKT